jgi:integrase
MNPAQTSLAIKNTVVTDTRRGTCLIEGCEGHVGFHFKPSPKSVASARWLPIPETLREALIEHRRAQRRAATPDGWLDNGLIFPGGLGGPIHPDTVTDEFKAVVKKAGLPELSGPHALRHMICSTLLAEGKPVEVVAQITGHSMHTLRKTYAHLIQQQGRETIQHYERLILGRAGLPGVTAAVEEPVLDNVTPLRRRSIGATAGA